MGEPTSTSIALFPVARGESAPATDPAIWRWPRYSMLIFGVEPLPCQVSVLHKARGG
jgi:hypothetical protein